MVMVSILLIGDEILSGSVQESNLHPLVTALAAAGYSVDEVRIVPDHIERIAAALRELEAVSTYLITVGGIGPTHDDRTLEGVARAWNVPLQRCDQMYRFLELRYGTPLSPMVERMADIPEDTEIIGPREGRWPLIRRHNLFILPGLPVALRDKIPRMVALLPRRPGAAAMEILLAADENLFADWLTAAQDRHREVTIGSYPVSLARRWSTRIAVRGESREAVERCAEEIRRYAEANRWFAGMQDISEPRVEREDDPPGGHHEQ